MKEDHATKKDLVELEDRLTKNLTGVIDTKVSAAVEELTAVIREFAQQVDERFNRLEARVDKIEQNLERLTNTIDDFIKRLDTLETEKAARDAQFARLERWVEQLAKETGVKLVY